MNVAVATRMTVDEIGLALGIFCKLFEEDPRTARRHLAVSYTHLTLPTIYSV